MRRGCVYRRTAWHCTTCGRRNTTADRKACEAAGHTVEKRKSPVYWIKYVRDGKSYAESSESERKKVAEDLLAKRQGEVVGGSPSTHKMGKLTFNDAADDLLLDYKSNGLASYPEADRRIRKHLKPFFGGARMANITTSDVNRFIVKRQTEDTVLVTRERREADGTVTPEVRKPASNAEINRELALLKRMYSLAIEAGKLLHKPAIKTRKESAARTGFFELEQYESLLRHLPAEVQPVIAFAYITGWRIRAEVLTLEWKEVDFKAGEIRLTAEKSKNEEGRVFPMPPNTELRRLLEAQHAEHERVKKSWGIRPYVFFREEKQTDGRMMPVAIKSFKNGWKSAVLKAGCPGRIPHDLRRTAVRNLVRAGISEHVAMQMTGHKTRSVFDRYHIISGTDLRDAAYKHDDAMRVDRNRLG